jgi:hypothetical protein
LFLLLRTFVYTSEKLGLNCRSTGFLIREEEDTPEMRNITDSWEAFECIQLSDEQYSGLGRHTHCEF